MSKYELMHKVLNSGLTAKQKALLVKLILHSDNEWHSFPGVESLAKAASIKHARNLDVHKELEGLVRIEVVGRQNHYYLDTSALADLSTVDTSATEEVLDDSASADTSAVEEVFTSAPAEDTSATAADTSATAEPISTKNTTIDNTSISTTTNEEVEAVRLTEHLKAGMRTSKPDSRTTWNEAKTLFDLSFARYKGFFGLTFEDVKWDLQTVLESYTFDRTKELLWRHFDKGEHFKDFARSASSLHTDLRVQEKQREDDAVARVETAKRVEQHRRWKASLPAPEAKQESAPMTREAQLAAWDEIWN